VHGRLVPTSTVGRWRFCAECINIAWRAAFDVVTLVSRPRSPSLGMGEARLPGEGALLVVALFRGRGSVDGIDGQAVPGKRASYRACNSHQFQQCIFGRKKRRVIAAKRSPAAPVLPQRSSSRLLQ